MQAIHPFTRVAPEWVLEKVSWHGQHNRITLPTSRMEKGGLIGFHDFTNEVE